MPSAPPRSPWPSTAPARPWALAGDPTRPQTGRAARADTGGDPRRLAVRLIRGGTVVTESGVRRADVGIDGGRVAAVGEELAGDTFLDATGLHVLPGFVDPHVHGCDEGLAEWEDFGTLTAAALAGGVTTLLDMPLNDPPTTTAAAFARRSAVVRAGARCDVGLWAGAVPGNVGE